ncbi:TIM barrel protein [Martelella radicis]|uniref:D-psicose/D-tagatose/L-ribulose 3-epimerase n=1 Tax=Martelella radicis TaxID=1397476 RepID=A0A7W6PA37_9HYPH|nr:D-psicose/D-tagatose/L-ribulose 3-epimerase [Martelella radicis]
MTNPIGIISMQFARPFGREHMHLFRHMRTLGFDLVELLVPEPEDGLDLKALKAALDEAGLGVALAARVNLQRSISDADRGIREGGMGYLRYCLEVAHALGATSLGGPLYGAPMVFAGRAPTPVAEEEMKARGARVIEGLGVLAPEAQAAGTRLALEPLNRYETDVISLVSQAVAVVDAVNHPALGVLFDTFHANIEEKSIPDAIRLAGERIVYFQANENNRGYPGTGHIDWQGTMQALADVGYKGPITLEPFRRDDDERIGLPIAQWRPPHEDESEKLTEAIAFIRDLLAKTGGRS